MKKRSRRPLKAVRRPRPIPVGRLRLSALCFVAVIGAFGFRLGDLQLTPDPAFAQPITNPVRQLALEARRGALLDRQGRPLAVSFPSATIAVDPREVDPNDAALVVSDLSQLIDTDPQVMLERITGDKHFGYLDRQVDLEVGEAIMALEHDGIFQIEEPRRTYPNGDCTGMALLGRVDIDHLGISGIEALYDDRLTGIDGTRIVEVSGFDRSATIVGGEQIIEPAIPGEELSLSLHRDVQFKAQEIIEQTVAEHNADKGVALVMIPATGEIVAAVSAQRDTETGLVECTTNNLPFTHVYEPGSTMKTITLAAAIEHDATYPTEPISLPHQLNYTLDEGRTFPIVDWFPHAQSVYTPTEILTRSSNIGTAVLAERIGADAMNDAMADFGFGQLSGIGFPGESAGIMKDLGVSTVALPTGSYGQGVAVTPIQMLQAYNAIANGGVAVDPVLVLDDVGQSEPTEVISADTATQMMGMMRSVVTAEDGTGRAAAVEGYDVVGKTGTAWQPCGVGYSCTDGRERHYTPSFAGIVSNDAGPQFSIIVVVDNPVGGEYGGGAVAAPAFAEIAAYTARQLRVPTSTASVTTTAVRAETAVDPADSAELALDAESD